MFTQTTATQTKLTDADRARPSTATPRPLAATPAKAAAAAPVALKAVGSDGHGPFAAMELPFERDALMPHISAKTLSFHFDKHFKTYLDKTNALIGGSELAGLGLEDVVRQASKGRKRGLLANAAQSWNHGFFWKSLSPTRSTRMGVPLERALIDAFGSIAKFREKFIKMGTSHLGSGWIWLSHEAGKGLVLSTTREATPVWLNSKRQPLMVCDLWEHAYYLDWMNDRAGFLNGFINELANWDFAGSQLEAIMSKRAGWTYPINR